MRTIPQIEYQALATLKKGIESKLKELKLSKKDFAKKLNISASRLSTLLNNPDRGEVWNLTELIKLQQILMVEVIISKTGISLR